MAFVTPVKKRAPPPQKKTYPRKLIPSKPLPTAPYSRLRVEKSGYVYFTISNSHIKLHPNYKLSSCAEVYTEFIEVKGVRSLTYDPITTPKRKSVIKCYTHQNPNL